MGRADIDYSEVKGHEKEAMVSFKAMIKTGLLNLLYSLLEGVDIKSEVRAPASGTLCSFKMS